MIHFTLEDAMAESHDGRTSEGKVLTVQLGRLVLSLWLTAVRK